MAQLAETLEAPAIRTSAVLGRLAAVAAWAIWLVGMVVAFAVLWVGTSVPFPSVITYRSPAVLIAMVVMQLSFTNVALVLTLRERSNLVAWLFATTALVTTVQIGGTAYVAYALHRGMPPLLAGSDGVASWSSAISLPGLAALLALIALFFPDGRLPSRRWLPVALAVVAGGVGLGAYFLWRPGALVWFPGILNPFGQPALDELLLVLYFASVLVLCASGAAAAFGMFLRYRAANMTERHQIKWVAYAIGISTVLGSIFFATHNFTVPQSSAGEMGLVGALLGAAFLPIATAVACLRYNLYDIDLIINRTVAWIGLTAVLGGLYAASVAFFQRVFVAITGDPSDSAIIVSTLLLAGVFSPMRKTLEGVVDRRFRSSHLTATARENANAGAPASVDEPVAMEGLGGGDDVIDESELEAMMERVVRRVVNERAQSADRPA